MKWMKLLFKNREEKNCRQTILLYTGPIGYTKYQNNLPFEGWSKELATETDQVIEVPNEAIKKIASREFNYRFGVVFKVQI